MAIGNNKKEPKPHLTQQAHDLIRNHFANWRMHPNVVIDATCGNGNDTLFLAQTANKVFAFDIQEIALTKTRDLLIKSNLIDKVELIQTGHENMAEYVSDEIDCIMFNLGYLPKADKSVTTFKTTTLSALKTSLRLLSKNDSLLSVLCYPGHAEGKIETQAIKQWLKELPCIWHVKEYLANYPNERSPVLFHVTHKKTSTTE